MKAWLLVLIVAVIAQVFAWLWQRRTGNATLVDAVWAFGVGVSAMLLALLGQGANLPRLLLATLAGIWGLRLGLHLLRRALHESEDGRYAHLRAHWGNDQRKWFGFFMVQALLIALFALPFVPVAANPEGIFGISDFFAIAIWLIAIAGEWQADAQLARFRANPEHRGQVFRSGWWRYSRHPNYFFEWLHWFAYPLLAWGAPHWWLAWLGPVVMYVFLRWLSGIPWTEAQSLRSRGEAYREYQRTTSILIPWFPRSPR